MRSLLVLPAAALALAAFVPVATPTVEVHAECDGGQLGAHSVTPDSVTIVQDQDLDWELDASSTATDLTIMPKHPGHWPYANDEHFKGGKGKDHKAHANGHHMNKGAAGSYPYSIELSCPDGHGGSTDVTIDPTIIVHGG